MDSNSTPVCVGDAWRCDELEQRDWQTVRLKQCGTSHTTVPGFWTAFLGRSLLELEIGCDAITRADYIVDSNLAATIVQKAPHLRRIWFGAPLHDQQADAVLNLLMDGLRDLRSCHFGREEQQGVLVVLPRVSPATVTRAYRTWPESMTSLPPGFNGFSCDQNTWRAADLVAAVAPNQLTELHTTWWTSPTDLSLRWSTSEYLAVLATSTAWEEIDITTRLPGESDAEHKQRYLSTQPVDGKTVVALNAHLEPSFSFQNYKLGVPCRFDATALGALSSQTRTKPRTWQLGDRRHVSSWADPVPTDATIRLEHLLLWRMQAPLHNTYLELHHAVLTGLETADLARLTDERLMTQLIVTCTIGFWVPSSKLPTKSLPNELVTIEYARDSQLAWICL